MAGVDKDERGAVEAAVRQGLGARAADGPWSVSVVQLAGKWSVTLDGGGLRSASAVAERAALADAIRSLVGEGRSSSSLDAAPTIPPSPGPPPRVSTAAAPAGGPLPAAAPRVASEVRARHECGQCGRDLVVVYEACPDEPLDLAPVACPHCWAIGQVEVGAWAAAGRDYRSEKA
ncbi:MAG TPA: hypothetical protein VGB87_20130 [Vicinamibacteria bacterium]